MARVKRSVHGRKHHRAVLEQAKGYYGNKSRTYRAANEQVMHSLQYAYRDRRARKGDFRKLWIQRINAAARAERPELQPLHRRPAPGRRGGRPQDPGRPGRERRRGLRRPGRAGRPARCGRVAGRRGRLLSQELGYSHQRVRRLRRLLHQARDRAGPSAPSWPRASRSSGAALGRRLRSPRRCTWPPEAAAAGGWSSRWRPTCSRPAAGSSRSRGGVVERVADTVTPQPSSARRSR